MKQLTSAVFLVVVTAVTLCLMPNVVQAQCYTCPTTYQASYAPATQVAYSPVAYNNYAYDGWYLGKYLGRMSRKVFGTAPAPAYQASYPTTYAAGYAPAYTYAAARPAYSTYYRPQTVYRPVVMQPVQSCSTCYAPAACNTCNSCSTVGQATYLASPSSTCSTCTTSYAPPAVTTVIESSPAPTFTPRSAAPSSTFREKQTLDPIPAEESSFDSRDERSFDSQNTSWEEAPKLHDPSDRVTKRPTAPVWHAVYKQSPSDNSYKVRTAATESSTQRALKSQPRRIESTGWTASP